jgi:type III secretory pathway component EscS
MLGFLNSLTPKPDKAQTIDLTLKLVAEVVAFCQINGIPGDSIGDFVGSLGEYGGESLIRMVALVCVDGLIPLGPDFINKALSGISRMSPQDLNQNQTFQSIKNTIPGSNDAGKLNFIGESFDSVKGWMSGLVNSHNLTPQKVIGNLQSFTQIADDKLDYLAAFLDVATNYYEHTGTQTLARRLIERAVAEI